LDLTTKDQQDGWNALERLLRIARQDTGQARRVANFLLAWHNAEENGGWDEIAAVWRLWRGGQTSTEPDPSAGRKETT
jgi:hypothetical protein